MNFYCVFGPMNFCFTIQVSAQHPYVLSGWMRVGFSGILEEMSSVTGPFEWCSLAK